MYLAVEEKLMHDEEHEKFETFDLQRRTKTNQRRRQVFLVKIWRRIRERRLDNHSLNIV